MHGTTVNKKKIFEAVAGGI